MKEGGREGRKRKTNPSKATFKAALVVTSVLIEDEKKRGKEFKRLAITSLLSWKILNTEPFINKCIFRREKGFSETRP